MPQVKIAKATEKDFDSVRDFFYIAELMLERQKFSLRSPEDEWETLDEDDDDFILCKKIQANLKEELGEKPDNRIVAYEFLMEKFNRGAGSGWQRVVMAADILIDNVTDPTESHLSFHPGLEFFHVAPEM